MFLTVLTIIHTLISIVAIVAGIIVTADLLRGRDGPGSSTLFMATALLTSLTGFIFPFTQFLPSHGVGIVALLVLAITLPARYRFRMAGAWRWIYASGTVVSLYLLVFVAIAQAFIKVPSLAASAPNLEGPSFAITQAIAFVIFAFLGIAAARKARLPLAQQA